MSKAAQSIAHRMTMALEEKVNQIAKTANVFQRHVFDDGRVFRWQYGENGHIEQKEHIGTVEAVELLPKLVIKYITNNGQIKYGTPEEKEKIKAELLKALQEW